MQALVIGGTGLVGRELLAQLANDPDFETIVSAGRRIIPEAPSRVQQIAMDLLRDPLPQDVTPDVVFCCLGTTIKVAGSQEAFRKVDYDMPLRIARSARERGAQQFVIITSIGADAKSTAFYTRVKGEVERDVRALGYPSLTIVRPSLLLGDRAEHRFGEQVATLLMLTFSWLIPLRWKAVKATAVAASMVRAAKQRVAGARVVTNEEIVE